MNTILTSILTNWKTSGTGLLSVLGGALGLAGVKATGVPTDPNTAITAIIAGLGLIFAGDASATPASTTKPPAKS